jgi:hypothetical protein
MTDWRHTDTTFKSILARNDSEDEMESVANTKRELASYLITCPLYSRLNRKVISQLEDATTFYSLNNAIAKIYDYADAEKIWLGFLPTVDEVKP